MHFLRLLLIKHSGWLTSGCYAHLVKIDSYKPHTDQNMISINMLFGKVYRLSTCPALGMS